MTSFLRLLAALTLFFLTLCIAPQSHAQIIIDTRPGAETTIRVDVDALLIPVVVQDAQGRTVGTLRKEDFKVLDQGKERAITGFTLVQNAPNGEPAKSGAEGAANAGGSAAGQGTVTAGKPAERYTVFLFDDRHLNASDLEQVKVAGVRMLGEALGDADRAVVLSFLGINSGMTHDHGPLQAAVMKLKPQEIGQHDSHQCPDIDYFTADQILNKHSTTEYQIAWQKAAVCTHLSERQLRDTASNKVIDQLVQSAATTSLELGDEDVRATLGFVKNVIHTLSGLPGQRSLILISPGFLSDSHDAMALQQQIMDLAVASNVTISALDARGLYVGNVGASESGSGSGFGLQTGQVSQSHSDSTQQTKAVMANLADGTGGEFVHDGNDLRAGMKSLMAGPEFRYLLQVSLGNVKANGTFHALKVEVKQPGLTLRARKGYFAPVPLNSKK